MKRRDFLVAGAVPLLAPWWRLNRRASWLLVPYLAWVSFASVLNAGFWWLNR